MKYKSELIRDILEVEGHKSSSLHYESECIEEWIESVRGGYPKLCDYEGEWLNYYLENGGIGEFPYEAVTNVTDATIHHTVPIPFKSAILSGNTSVNIVNNDNWERGTGVDIDLFTQNISIKKGQTYTVIGKMEKSDIIRTEMNPAFRIRTGDDNGGTSLVFVQESDADIKQTFTNNENDTIHIRFFNQKTNYKKLMIIEGDYTNQDIPYFEGMASVKTSQTLVNVKGEKSNDNPMDKYSNHDFLIPLVKKNTDYLIKYDTTLSGGVLSIGFLNNNDSWSNNLEEQPNIGLIRLNSGEYPNYFRIVSGREQTVSINNLMIIEYQEGMENWDIPYFEGMQSVKMPVLTTTGKNLMDINSRDINSINYHGVTYSIDNNGYYSIKGTLTSQGRWVNTFDLTKSETWGNSTIITEDFMLKKGTYTLSACDISGETSTHFNFIRLFKKPFTTIIELYERTSKTFTLNEDTKLSMMFQTVNYNSGDSIDVKFKVQIEEGTQATTYEPFKSNILTVNEEVELRGIGDVKDELDLLTGKLTQRIVEVVLDGSEEWLAEDGRFTLEGVENVVPNRWSFLLSDKYPSYSNLSSITQYASYIIGNGWGQSFHIRDAALFPNPKNQLSEFKEYLSQNPVTVQYQSATESIKTVGLTITNQEGVSVNQLKAMNETTHIETNGTPIKPFFTGEIPVEAIEQNLNSFIEQEGEQNE